MFLRRALGILPLAVSFLLLAAPAHADPKRMDDRDPAGPVIDGQLGAGEYRAWSDGTGSGFGGMIGQGVRLWVDSAADGTIGFLLDQTGQNCTLGPDDSIVLYLDTKAGGIHTTYHLTDASDGGRRAVSGFDGQNRAELGFELGFEPDFAIVVRGDSGSLYQLVENGPLQFVKSLTRAPLATFGTSCIKEFGGFTMGDVGAAPGHVLAYVGTLINASNDGSKPVAIACDRQIFADFIEGIEGVRPPLLDAAQTLSLTEACLVARQSADDRALIRRDVGYA